MGTMQTPAPVKLFVGLLTSIPAMIPRAEERLAAVFGAVDARSDILPFDLTHYYDASMGFPIYRAFFSFASLIEPSAIADIKIRTNEMEAARF